MSERFGTRAIAALAVSLVLVGMCFASSFSITNVNINNLQNPGQQLTASQPTSSFQWGFTTSFNLSGGNGATASIDPSALSYFGTGKTITAAYPLQITGTPETEAVYAISNSSLVPIKIMWSNVTLGSVYQGPVYQNATVAPLCAQSKNYYTEWDIYVVVQPSIFSGAKNVVVARVCIYAKTAGLAELLPNAPNLLPFVNLTLSSNGQREYINLFSNSTSSTSPDNLASASWDRSYLATAVAPNGSKYAVVKNSSSGVWIVQDSGTYNQWHTQYYRFTQSQIPAPKASYSPASIGVVSNSCAVISQNNLSNASVAKAAACLNQTASLYYTLSNQFTTQIFSNGQTIGGYNVSFSNYGGNAAAVVNLPGYFTSDPKISFIVSGQFLGASLPGGFANIISMIVSPIGIDGNGLLKIVFENAGKMADLFTVSISNCSVVSTQNGTSYQAASGQQLNITVPIMAPNANLSFSQQCTVAVSGTSGGGQYRIVNITTETPNQFIHVVIQKVEDRMCNNLGFFSQFACSYLGSATGINFFS